MGSHLVEPGAMLADRYEIEDLLAEEGPSSSWRAHDKVLARSVVVQILPSASPEAGHLLSAAKQASRVTDPRLLQVLDAVDDGELSYVVREWTPGEPLDVMLAEGPLSARRAAWLVREVASVMCRAHRSGVPHGRLAPDAVVVTTSSGVKVNGLGTFAALRSAAENEAPDEQEDACDLGRLLYACLTARWPGNSYAGLAPAPTEHGRLLRPRQVRAGVPRSLDAVCDRILNESSRYGPHITTVPEVAAVLSDVLANEGFPTGVGVADTAAQPDPLAHRPIDPPPALLPRDAGPPPGEQPRYAPTTANRPTTSRLRRSLILTTAAVLVSGVALLAYLVGQRGPGGPSADASEQTTSQPTSPVPVKPLPVVSSASFDPPPDGSGDEHPELVPFATDDDPNTSWETEVYFDQLGPPPNSLKRGVGLVLDLGQVQPVRGVQLTTSMPGADLEIRTAPASMTTVPQASADEYAVQEQLRNVAADTRALFDEPVRSRFVLVWLTKLPPVPTGDFRGSISEVRVLG